MSIYTFHAKTETDNFVPRFTVTKIKQILSQANFTHQQLQCFVIVLHTK